MALHARQVAAAAGAPAELVDPLAEQMVNEDNIRIERAVEILRDLECKMNPETENKKQSLLLKPARPVGIVGYGAYVPHIPPAGG